MIAAAREQTAAASRGDTAGALAAFRRRGYPPGLGDERELEFLDRLGDEAPDWLIARWACETAFDWLIETEDARVERAAWSVAPTHGPPPPGAKPVEIVQRLQLIAAHDRLAIQHALFELGGLADFLDLRAEAGLLVRAPRLAEWPGRRWSVYEQVELRDDVLRVRDTVSGKTSDVVHLGTGNGVGRDVMLFGRVAPTNAHPGWVFVHRPAAVDPRTADRLVPMLRGNADCDEIFACIGDATVHVRVASAPGLRLRTRLWSDTLLEPDDYAAAGMVDGRTYTLDDNIEKMDSALAQIDRDNPETAGGPPGRLVELREAGVSDDVATGILTCEAALLIAELNRDGQIDGGRELAAANAASNLWYPPIVDGVREHATPPGSGPLWRDIAACVADPFRSICLDFAETAEDKAHAA